MRRTDLWNALTLAAALTIAACSNAPVPTAFDAAPARVDATAAIDLVRPDAVRPDTLRPDTCAKRVEVCDGVDNNCSGVADDLDRNADGVFDCQRILALGRSPNVATTDFQAWLKSNGARGFDRMHDKAGAPALTKTQLGAYSVVVVEWLQRSYSAAEAALVEQWVRAGGGLVALAGHDHGVASRARLRSLIAGLGVGVVDGERNAPVTAHATHAVTRGLKAIPFTGGYRLQTTNVSGVTNTTIAQVADGPVGIAQLRGAGRALVWGDEWITFDSQWRATTSDAKPLWINIAKWLARQP